MPYDRPKTRADRYDDHYERLREILKDVEAYCYDGECRQLPNAGEFRFLAGEVVRLAKRLDLLLDVARSVEQRFSTQVKRDDDGLYLLCPSCSATSRDMAKHQLVHMDDCPSEALADAIHKVRKWPVPGQPEEGE